MAEKDCFTIRELAERLIQLETAHKLKCTENEKALVLARDLIARETHHTCEQIDAKLLSHNNFQIRIDNMIGTFATKAMLDKEVEIAKNTTDMHFKINGDKIDSMKKSVYFAIGALSVLTVLLQFIFHIMKG